MPNDYSFIVAVYDGPASAQAVFNILKNLQTEKALDIKEAAVFTRSGSKIHMNNQGFVGTGKGGVLGLVIGAVVVSAPLAGLVVGGLIGFGHRAFIRLRTHTEIIAAVDLEDSVPTQKREPPECCNHVRPVKIRHRASLQSGKTRLGSVMLRLRGNDKSRRRKSTATLGNMQAR